jgi:hypothetical protein
MRVQKPAYVTSPYQYYILESYSIPSGNIHRCVYATDMNGTSPSSNLNLSPRKKGKNSDDESLELGIAGRLARGRVKAAVEAASAPADAKAKVPRARAKGGVASDDDNGLSVRLRRSNRQLPKVARRA